MTEHTPGPWAWFGNDHGFYLATTHSGRRFVMDFVRMGMRGAQPRFQLNSRMVNGADLVEFEVSDLVKGFPAGKAKPEVYRLDIIGIDHPDARLIAAAPETAAERDKLREINADLLAALEGLADYWEAAIKGTPDVANDYASDGFAFMQQARTAIAKARSK